MYDHPSQFEPLLPRDEVAEEALGMAHDLRTEAAKLAGACQNGVSQELSRLLRAMNSYYSNKIEGEHTRPLEIEQALAHDFSADADKARLQRLAVAHIATEAWISSQALGVADAYGPEFVMQVHGHLFGQLSDEDRLVCLHDATGAVTEVLTVEPGALRTREVAVKRHVAPAAAAVPACLDRWSQAYAGARRGEMQVVAAAAAHHRLAWIHPFADGNGRAARLQSVAALQALGLTGGLWSPLRGLARHADRYSERLGNADLHRMGDLDGRGNLSERMLVEWICFFIELCLDQVRFMTRMLNLQDMQDRLGAFLAHEEHVVKRGLRREALRPLHYLFATQGEISRGDFASMTGLGERTATTLISKLLEAGLLRSDTPKGHVRFAVPLHALRFLFPSLWPEAEADVAAG